MARHIHDLFWQLDALRQHVEQNGGLLNDIGQSRSDREANDRSLDVASRESLEKCGEMLRQQIEQNRSLLNHIRQLCADSKVIDRSLIEGSRDSMKQCREALRQANRLSFRFDD